MFFTQARAGRVPGDLLLHTTACRAYWNAETLNDRARRARPTFIKSLLLLNSTIRRLVATGIAKLLYTPRRVTPTGMPKLLMTALGEPGLVQ